MNCIQNILKKNSRQKKINKIISCFFFRSLFIFALYELFLVNSIFAETKTSSWILGAEKFKYPQVQDRQTSEQEVASVIPQLVLEQITASEIRLLPTREVLNRKLDELLTARISLFLQLSKEFQTRDALVLTIENPRELERAIKEENKKIADIQKKIDENLAESNKEVDNNAGAIEAEEIMEEQNDAMQSGDETKTVVKSASEKSVEKRKQFALPFFKHSTENKPVIETVSLYKNDATSLFAASAPASEQGYSSRLFDREVVAAKINGLLTGSIISYGDYAAVTAELFLYPGGVSAGTITEVGLLEDPLSIAKKIARYLSPKIANSMPVTLEFSIVPEEAAEKATLTIDGIVFTTIPESAVVDAGIHTITIESDNFEMANATYSFSGNTRFTVRSEMVPENHGHLNLRIKKFADGVFYANGIEQGHPDPETCETVITVNGKAVLGRFVTGEGDEQQSAFYYIPADKAHDENNLSVNVKPYDRAANIDKRRRRMYTAYSALVCSLPIYFYCYGNFTSSNNAYELQRVSVDDVEKWQQRSLVAGGVSVTCGAWFIFELAKYLIAANEVLPAPAKIDNKKR